MKAKKLVCFAGILAAVVMIIVGFCLKLPDKYVYVSSSSSAYHTDWAADTGAEYVGGDAYNIQIEATLKAGYLTGLMTEKAVCVVGGVLLLFLSLFTLVQNQQMQPLPMDSRENENNQTPLSLPQIQPVPENSPFPENADSTEEQTPVETQKDYLQRHRFQQE